jgi:Kef-type K+ transport system membrane component KefB
VRKVLLYSVLLLSGLVASQFLPRLPNALHSPVNLVVTLLTMMTLAFIMIHVGYEFDIDKSRLRSYAWDYFVAATTAGFPWIFCACYFIFVMEPRDNWFSFTHWKESLLVSRFAAPTSAGVLFSMLAAAGLGATWIFKKARVLAIFDDLDTVLLMIPLKMMMVGFRWQLIVVVILMLALLWICWRYLHAVRIPISWPWVLLYSALLTIACEAAYLLSQMIDVQVPIHIEILLPAFVLGTIIMRPEDEPTADEAEHAVHHHFLETPQEKRVSHIVSSCFMVLVGLSMPPVLDKIQTADVQPPPAIETRLADAVETVDDADDESDSFDITWGMIAWHVLIVTIISNIGKMFPAFCYRREAHFRERVSVALGMCPRGEVGAGVLVISLSYGVTGPAVTVAMLSLTLNLLLTGVFILAIQRLLADIENTDREV